MGFEDVFFHGFNWVNGWVTGVKLTYSLLRSYFMRFIAGRGAHLVPKVKWVLEQVSTTMKNQ